MFNLFLACTVLGGALLIFQLLSGALGAEHALHGHDVHEGGSAGLHLFSVRALSAGVAFFGIGGAAALSAKQGATTALTIAGVAGAGAMLLVALLTRSLTRLESDGAVQIEGAVGKEAVVYLTIPGEKSGVGKVTLSLQNRLVEYQAVTPLGALPTGTPVTVVDVVGPDTVEVVQTPTVGDVV